MTGVCYGATLSLQTPPAQHQPLMNIDSLSHFSQRNASGTQEQLVSDVGLYVAAYNNSACVHVYCNNCREGHCEASVAIAQLFIRYTLANLSEGDTG